MSLTGGGLLVVASGVLVCALALGGSHVLVLLAVAPVLIGGSVCVVASGAAPLSAPLFRLTLALAGMCLLQALPLPTSWVHALNPKVGDVWSRALHPFGESVAWAALSADRGASLVEALKWFVYGLVGLSAGVATRRYGARVVSGVLFVVALMVAGCTLAHGVFDARLVFGVYEPRFGAARWRVGPFLNPNNLAGFMNLGLFAGLGLASSGRLRAYRAPVLGGVALLAAVCVLTGSRGGVLAALLGAGAFVWFARGGLRGHSSGSARSASMVAVAALAGGGALAMVGAQQTTWRELFASELGKLALFRRTLAMIADHPVFGVGRGAFESVSPAYGAARSPHVAAHAENLLLQWAAEWGLPVSLGLCALVVLVARRAQHLGPSSARAGLKAGIVAVLLQNGFDMGLELPALALALAAAVGALTGRAPARPRSGADSRRLALALGAAGAVLWFGVAAFGRPSVSDERERLTETARAASGGAEVRRAYASLRSAMLRHPAEPHFARLGGWMALRAELDPMPWVTRAIERDPVGGRTRVLAAQALQRRGALGQALAELRSASELEPGLASVAGRLAGTWTQDVALLARLAPGGTIGAELLTNAAQRLGERGVSVALRERCLGAAVERDPSYVPARRGRMKLLVQRAERGECAETSHCFQQSEADARALGRLSPSSAEAVILRARLLAALERGQEAVQLLGAACSRYSSGEKTRCLLEIVRLLRSTPGGSHAELANAARAAAESCDALGASCGSVLIEVGQALAAAGAWGSALSVFERASVTMPSAEAWLGVAAAAGAIGQYGRAQRALEHAARLATGDVAASARVQAQKQGIRRQMLERVGGVR